MKPKANPKPNTASEKRVSPRVELAPVKIRNLTSIDRASLITRAGTVVDASNTGFLLRISRADLVPVFARESLTLNELIGNQILLILEAMDLEISGRVVRSKRIDKTTFEVGIDYTEDAPEYWRECLMDLLPRPGEFE